MSAPLAYIFKDKDATKPYTIDWQKFLDAGDTIATAVWNVATGLTSANDIVIGGLKTRIWISGGTTGAIYDVVCHITSVAGIIDDRTLRFEITEE